MSPRNFFHGRLQRRRRTLRLKLFILPISVVMVAVLMRGLRATAHLGRRPAGDIHLEVNIWAGPGIPSMAEVTPAVNEDGSVCVRVCLL